MENFLEMVVLHLKFVQILVEKLSEKFDMKIAEVIRQIKLIISIKNQNHLYQDPKAD